MLEKGKRLLLSQSFWLYIFLSFPIVDYILRNILPIPVVSSLWDEGVMIILILFVFSHVRGSKHDRPLPSIKIPLTAFFIMGIAYLIADMENFGASVEGFRATFEYIVAFFIGYHLFRSMGQAKKSIYVLVVVATLVGFYGVIQRIIGVETPSGWSDASEAITTRAFSIVQSPNVLGSYMILMAPIAAGLVLMSKTWKQRIIWLGMTLIMLAALLFTGSRGAWLALAASIGLLGIMYDRRILIGGLIAAVLVVFLVPSVQHRFTSLFSPTYVEKSTKDGRIARWAGAYDMMRYEPLFGKGMGHYGGAVAERNFGTIYVDSYYFKTLAETGIVGLALFFWLMFTLIKEMLRSWRAVKTRGYQFVAIGIFTGLVAVIFHNGVENIFEVPFMNAYFWLLAGMILSFPFLENNKGENSKL
jgi:putative inorganic carbon (hco3(-)) transporter